MIKSRRMRWAVHVGYWRESHKEIENTRKTKSGWNKLKINLRKIG
jgi:hypothetical protein